MSKVMNFKEIRDKLYLKLDGTGWDDELRFFIRSGDFISILEKLHHEMTEGRRFTPPINDLFKPFELVHFDKIKVVFILNEGYSNPVINTGLPLSYKNVDFPPFEFYWLQKTLQVLYPGLKLDQDLYNWTSQGILILPLVNTTQVGRSMRHESIWAGFSSFVLDVLKNKDVVFVMFGKNNMVKNLPNLIQVDELPKDRDVVWNDEGLFEKINEKLIEKITW